MPELPEVQTIVSELKNIIIGAEILDIKVFRNSAIIGSSDSFIHSVKNKKFLNVIRKGKYIILELSGGQNLFVHLRMTGKLIYLDSFNKPAKHDRVAFFLGDKKFLVFNDIRSFGKIEHCNDPKNHKGLGLLGMDALDKKLDVATIKNLIEKCSLAIKTKLLDQKFIAGIGNIYASEILFDAEINPLTPAKDLNNNQIQRMLKATRKILKKAVEKNGTTISDYQRVDKKTGEFQNFLKVYQKQNQKCPTCKTLIQKIKLNQRSTYFCPQCQK